MTHPLLTKKPVVFSFAVLLTMAAIAFCTLAPEAAYAADGSSAALTTGETLKGWQKENGKWYYYDDNGNMIQSRSFFINGKLYLFSKSGALITATGWQGLKEYKVTDWYYVKNSNGELQTGWLKDAGKWYYLDKEYGLMCSTKSERIDGKAYLFSTSGALVTKTGWYCLKNNHSNPWYYIKNSNGELHLGWLKDGDTWYCFEERYGFMFRNTEMNVGNKYYLLSSSGAMVTKPGWHAIKLSGFDTEWYFIKNSSGELHTGWLEDGGTWYYMRKIGGAMLHDCCEKADGKPYLFSKSGAIVTKTGWHSTKTKSRGGYEYTHWHYVKNSNGDLYEGWLKESGKWYYLNNNGYMSKSGSTKVGSKLYLFFDSGVLVTKTGWVKLSGNWYYVKNSNGEAHTGWKKDGGKWYYLRNDDGSMIANTTTSIGGKEYTFDTSGALVEG